MVEKITNFWRSADLETFRQVWGGWMADHLFSKYLSVDRDLGKFLCNLDSTNQEKLEAYLQQN